MSNVSSSSESQFARIEGYSLARFIPEPKSRAAVGFGSLLSGAATVAGEIAGIAGGVGDPLNQTLLLEQLRSQREMQTVSLISNVEKSKHETQMVAIRNIRVG
ncbi:MAG: hypothetical protein DCC75_09495 [Proteobacteria bacterium]|nr:MAG: hypothetical protein DCC75_09495 [Pseudomonadota bacterium]